MKIFRKTLGLVFFTIGTYIALLLCYGIIEILLREAKLDPHNWKEVRVGSVVILVLYFLSWKIYFWSKRPKSMEEIELEKIYNDTGDH